MTSQATTPPGAPPNSATTPEGHRWYFHPGRTTSGAIRRDATDGDPLKLISVTTALDTVSSYGLLHYAAKGAATLAMDTLPTLVGSLLVEPCSGGPNRCRACPDCRIRHLTEWHERDSAEASDRGRRVHWAISQWIKFGIWPQVDPDIEQWINTFRRFVIEYGIEREDFILSEVTIVNLDHRYAGTLDFAVRVHASRTWRAAELVARLTGWPAGRVDLIVDVKTTRKEEPVFFPDMGYQLNGYFHADTAVMPDGAEYEMPPMHGAAVLQLCAGTQIDGGGQYEVRPVDTSLECFEEFLAHVILAKLVFERGTRIVGAKTFPLPDEMQATDAADKRVHAARKEAGLPPGRQPCTRAQARAAIAEGRVPTRVPAAKRAAGTSGRAAGTPAAGTPAAGTSGRAAGTPAAGTSGRAAGGYPRSRTATLDSIARSAPGPAGGRLTDDDIPF